MTRRHSTSRSLDDAGKPVRVFDGPGFREWQSSGDPRVKDLSRRATFVLTDRRFQLKDPDLLFFISPSLLIFLTFSFRSYLPGISLWIAVGLIGVVTMPLIHVGMRRRIARRSVELIRIILEEGICPCCGYNFFGLDLSPEHIHCPECGAVWATNRMRRVLPIDESVRSSPVASALRQSRDTTTVGFDDDRGRRVAMADPRLRLARRGAVAPERRRVLRDARSQLARVGLGIRLLIAAVPLGVALLCLLQIKGRLAAPPGGGGGAGGMGLSLLVPALFLALFGVSMLFSKLGYKPSRVRRILLSHSLCPSCASSLAGIPPDPTDGCVVCETCRAAWRPSSAAGMA